jgi:hypothetical protein
VYPIIVAKKGRGKIVVAARIHTQQQKNYCTRRFLCSPCRIKGKQAIGSQKISRVEAGSNTSTVALQVVIGEEKEAQCLGV